MQFLYIAAYNPSDAALQNLNSAKTILKEPEGGTIEWNGVPAWASHPKVSPEFREKTIQICRELGIKNPIVTTGEVSQIIRDMLQEGLSKYPFPKK